MCKYFENKTQKHKNTNSFWQDMVNQNKIFSFKIKRQVKNIFPRDVEKTVGGLNQFYIYLYKTSPSSDAAPNYKYIFGLHRSPLPRQWNIIVWNTVYFGHFSLQCLPWEFRQARLSKQCRLRCCRTLFAIHKAVFRHI